MREVGPVCNFSVRNRLSRLRRSFAPQNSQWAVANPLQCGSIYRQPASAGSRAALVDQRQGRPFIVLF
jgi:hypothetical protein